MKLSRLFPWYRWSDRWSLHIEHLPDAAGNTTLEWIAPAGFRFQLLSIQGHYESSVVAGNRYVHCECRRAADLYAHTSSYFLQLASKSYDYNFARHLNIFQSSIRDDTPQWPLPSSFVLLPGDRLNIWVRSNNALDQFTNWTVTAQKWID